MTDATAIERRGGVPAPVTYSKEQQDLIHQTLMPHGSEAELAVFIEYCKRSRLDPFAKQLYAIPVYDEKAGRYVYQFTTGIDGLRLVAERTQEYQGQDGPVWCGPDGIWRDLWARDEPPYACKVTVHRLGRRPVSRVVKYDEFVQRDRKGNPRGRWAVMPAHMLGIRAESHALRAAFPRETAGLYVDDVAEVVNPDAPASNAQKGELMRLSRLFGWTDEERHRQAGVDSFTKLTKGEANVLIDEWRLVETTVTPDEDEEDAPDGDESGEEAGDDDAEGQGRDPTEPKASSRRPHDFAGDEAGPCEACGWAAEHPVHARQGKLA